LCFALVFPFRIFFDGGTNERFIFPEKPFPVVLKYLFDGVFSGNGFQHIVVGLLPDFIIRYN